MYLRRKIFLKLENVLLRKICGGGVKNSELIFFNNEMKFLRGIFEPFFLRGIFEQFFLRGIFEQFFLRGIFEPFFLRGIFEPFFAFHMDFRTTYYEIPIYEIIILF